MKKNLQNKRPKNRNQILKDTNIENNKLKQTLKHLQKEFLIVKN
jgi:DNA-binding HxlR family transcriptional regulator